MRLFRAEQVREFDRKAIEEYGIPGVVLMENAGRQATERLVAHLPAPSSCAPIAVFAGPGNNGGDGYVMARHLLNIGYQVWTFLCAEKDKIRGDAQVNLAILEKMTDQIFDCREPQAWQPWKDKVADCAAIIDALLGTGLRKDVTGWFRTLIDEINDLQGPLKLAVDIPSGLDPDTGNPRPVCVHCDITTTFAAAKVGLAMPAAVPFVGRLEVIDIGMPQEILAQTTSTAELQEEAEMRALWPKRTFNSHKGTFGHLLVLAGSPGKTGAALLSCMAALRGGVGLCTLANSEDVLQSAQSQILEVMTASIPALDALSSEQDFTDAALTDVVQQTLSHIEGKSALAIGPGLSRSPLRERWLKQILQRTDLPVVIDADGLNLLAEQLEVLTQRKGPTVLTPHPGEMGRLTGLSTQEIQTDRLNIATQWAQKHNVTLVLKGARTIIVSPDGHCWLNSTGHSGLATAGTGDVLTGIIGAFLARGLAPDTAARLAVYVHGKSADALRETLGQSGLIAGDLLTQLPRTLAQWENVA